MSENKSFFKTLPGILTGLAALIGAVTGLYMALKEQTPEPPPIEPTVKQVVVTNHDPPIEPTPPRVVVTNHVETYDLAEKIRGIWKNADLNTRGLTHVETYDLAEKMRGIWKNADPNTRGLTKVVIIRKGGDTFVHAWGKCFPTDCDWGEAKGKIEGDILKVTWYWAGGERDMTLQLVGKRLMIKTIHVYNDNRSPRESSESFVRSS